MNSLKKIRQKAIKNLITKKNLKIAIWGFGLTGRSFLKWCQENLLNNDYFIFDKNKIGKNIEYNNIVYFSENDIQKYLPNIDFILISPGIKIEKNTFYFYHKIISEFDLLYYFFNKKKIKSILITGSIGKSSLTTIIYKNITTIKKAILCGNIGFPVLDFLNKDLSNDTIFCIEASDAQLKHSYLVTPTIFLITNVYQNHLNYHQSFKDYILAKLTPIRFQEKKIKNIIISDQAYIAINKIYKLNKIYSKLTLIYEEKNNIKSKEKISIKNNAIYLKNKIILDNIPEISFQINWAMTIKILLFFKENIKKIQKKFNEKVNLPIYRLEKIFSNNTLDIYNDSKSTIIEATIAGLNQLKKKYEDHTLFFILIGGLSKGVNREKGILTIASYQNTFITIFGKETETLKKNLPKNSFLFEELFEEASKKTIEKTKEGENKKVILFSPGGSSFDQFESFEDRGKKFNLLINKILKE